MAVQLEKNFEAQEIGDFSTGQFINSVKNADLHKFQHGQYAKRGHKTAEIIFDPFYTTDQTSYTYATRTVDGLNLYNFLPGLRLLRYMDDGSGNLVYTITIMAYMKNLDLRIETLDLDSETVNLTAGMSAVGSSYQWVETTIEFTEAQAFIGSSTANDRRQHVISFSARVNAAEGAGLGEMAQIAVYEKILTVNELPSASPS